MENNINYITLEGHGREDSISQDNIDISATLGWFTTMYPVKLDTGENIHTTINCIKEALRDIPSKGIGYGSIMGYTTLPLISFNYLGQLDQSNKNKQDNYWSITGEDSGTAVSSKNKDKNIININGAIVGGKLSFSVVSRLNEKLHNKLIKLFNKQLKEIIKYTSSLERSYLTASDIDKVVTQNYLDKLQDKGEIEAIYLANSYNKASSIITSIKVMWMMPI